PITIGNRMVPCQELRGSAQRLASERPWTACRGEIAVASSSAVPLRLRLRLDTAPGPMHTAQRLAPRTSGRRDPDTRRRGCPPRNRKRPPARRERPDFCLLGAYATTPRGAEV